MRKRDVLKMFTLQPGFLVVQYPRGVEPEQCRVDEQTARELDARGFYGGIILPRGIEIRSLSDAELLKQGLQRVPNASASEGKK